MKNFLRSLALFGILLSLTPFASGQEYPLKKILILVEGSSDLKNYAMGDGRQLADLMGHFNTAVTVKGVNRYIPGELNAYDYTFYIGFYPRDPVPQKFTDDVFSTAKPVIWMNTGMIEFSKQRAFRRKFGFSVPTLDSLDDFNYVKSNNRVFTKGEPNANIIEISNRRSVEVLAVAYSSRKRKEIPYIIQTKNLMYIADSPFASATENDRYLLFADMLHDILHEQHEESHSALIRIEDVDPLQNPDQLRDIADILSSRGIPFLVGVIPFYVDPSEGIRVSLSDKPDFVDAIKYMVKNGGTIVMHGITHQYKGTTAVDYEFWDESTDKPIRDETAEGDAKRIEMGLSEFMKNGLSPLVWETPHYTASFTLYNTIAKYFSTAMEQRLSIEDADYSQYFPYIINKDLFGQKIYPENLGYVPLNPNKAESEAYIQTIIRNAKTNLYVRDGFASVFFHPFLDLDLLKQLVDGIQGLGYTYIDLREQKNWVKMKDRVILTGSQNYTIRLEDQYLTESYFDHSGEIERKSISDRRIKGSYSKYVELEPGELYKAEPTEFRERPLSFMERTAYSVEKLYDNVFAHDEAWSDLRPVILWNHHVKGAAFNDQASLASVFRSVNVRVDTFFIGQSLNLSPYNLLIVPYAFVDSLRQTDYDVINAFVEGGGNIITDTRNDLAEELGIGFTKTQVRVSRIRDRYFPEERIAWRYPELVTKFETEGVDEVFCVDDVTETPMVIGKRLGKGKVIYFNSRFDSYSQHGYSEYPYLLEYVRKYFGLRPIVRRENLEMYFDPGYRKTYSIESLVKQWVREGIRAVDVAGWNQFPKYTWDYKRLITLAHANGILVYLWLEPPQVSKKFWDENPQWREKNYKGEDIPPLWRYAVALEDDSCLSAMRGEYMKILQGYDWDGVNLAELYFESGRGFETPLLFTPMHPSAQREVKRKYGIDLASIFNPQSPYYWKTNPAAKSAVIEYRVNQLTIAYDTLLTAFSRLAAEKPGFKIIVTAMDSYGSPELREFLGVDMSQVIELRKKFNFTLQVEDPENLWSTDPVRYREIGKRYAPLLGGDSSLALDLNILTFRKKEAIIPFPTLIQTGTESFYLLRQAALAAPKLTIYSESSVNPQDISFFANALAAKVEYRFNGNGYDVSSPYSFVCKMPKAVSQVNIDGSPLSPFRDNCYVIPAGSHELTLNRNPVNTFSTNELQAKIMSITGNLLSSAHGLRDITFEYESDQRTIASFNVAPSAVKVDHETYSFTVMKGNDCFSIFLPPGRHLVELVAGDQFSFGVNVTSLWSTTAIAIFGFIGVTSLFLMYLVLKVVKRGEHTRKAV
ncbi:MAG TPA: DUF2334 domain-containing protein [Bacteroidota bacterium]|nr:DUF2334 domain-containing protein [Bacteroidota bacterium]